MDSDYGKSFLIRKQSRKETLIYYCPGISEVTLEPVKTSKMELFCENS